MLLLLPLLLAGPLPESPTAFGFEPLFDGSTLDAWAIPEGDNGHWQIVNLKDGPVIDYDAGSEATGDKSLQTKRSFRNFVLELEWRWPEPQGLSLTPLVLPDGSYLKDKTGERIQVPRQNPDSGIYLRGHSKAQLNLWGWPVGSGEMYGYRHAASHPPEQRAAVTPLMRADRPYGEWNKFTVVLQDRELTVLLNDHTIMDRITLPEDLPEEGPIVLQHHGGRDAEGNLRASSSVVQFRNIFIKELPE